MDETAPSFEPTVADVKAAYRARMKRYHPDVYDGDGDAEAMSRRVLAAYAAVLGDEATDACSSRRPSDASVSTSSSPDVHPWSSDDADPFDSPEGPADVAFVDPFLCRGRACPPYCCCVERHPAGFEWTRGASLDVLATRRRGGNSYGTTPNARRTTCTWRWGSVRRRRSRGSRPGNAKRWRRWWTRRRRRGRGGSARATAGTLGQGGVRERTRGGAGDETAAETIGAVGGLVLIA